MANSYDVYTSVDVLGLAQISLGSSPTASGVTVTDVDDGGADDTNVLTSGEDFVSPTGLLGSNVTYSYYGNIVDSGGNVIGFITNDLLTYSIFVPAGTDLSGLGTLTIDLLSPPPTLAFETTEGWLVEEAEAACFVEGTMIATADGEVAVETLEIGDTIRTADGRDVAIHWIGRKTVVNRVGLEGKMEPVCIAAGALGNGMPHSDLYLSADHAVVVDGLMVTAGALVNGGSVRFVPLGEMQTRFTYFHIETEAHDEIIANGAVAETYLDSAGRARFDNARDYALRYGAERLVSESPRLRVTSQRLLPASLAEKLGVASDVFAEELDQAAA